VGPARDREIRQQTARLLRLWERLALPLAGDRQGSEHLNLKGGGLHAETVPVRRPSVKSHPIALLSQPWYPPNMEWVVVERDLPVGVTVERLIELAEEACLDLYGVTAIRSYLSSDRRRMICIFQAPDAEAVRTTLNATPLPPNRVWTSSLHSP